MKPLSGIRMIGPSLYLEDHQTLIIADLHIGIEDAHIRRGILLLKMQKEEFKRIFSSIFGKAKPETIVIDGDLKHEFGAISCQEWDDILSLLDFLSKQAKVILIEGNHDPLLEKIARKRGLAIREHALIGDFFICHGDRIMENGEWKKAKSVIIGHVHPAFLVDDGIRRERFKCFLVGKFKGKRLVVLPSFNPLIEGSDPDMRISPFLGKQHFDRYVIGKNDEVYYVRG